MLFSFLIPVTNPLSPLNWPINITTGSLCHTAVIVLMITCGQVCSCGHPLPDCGKNLGDGGPVSDGRSSGSLHHHCHRGPAHPRHPGLAHHLLCDHTQKPLRVHRRSAAGPRHRTGHLLQVSNITCTHYTCTSVYLDTLHLHTCASQHLHICFYVFCSSNPYTSSHIYTPLHRYTTTVKSWIQLYITSVYTYTPVQLHLLIITPLLMHICTSKHISYSVNVHSCTELRIDTH